MVAVKRILWAALGAFFIVIGISSVVAFGGIAFRDPRPIVFVGMLFALAVSTAGSFMFTRIPYDISCSNDSFELAFVRCRQRIPWEDLNWYRPVSFVAASMEHSGLWVLLCYTVRNTHSVSKRLALVAIIASGPPFGSVHEFHTELDRHVPEKRYRPR